MPYINSKSKNDANAIAYLKLKGIDPYVIKEYQCLGTIYESRATKHPHVVFPGLDNTGTPRKGVAFVTSKENLQNRTSDCAVSG